MKGQILVECGMPQLVDELPTMKPNRLGVIGRFWEHVHAFDSAHEYAYRVANPPKFNWLQVALAHVAYSPREHLRGEWVRVGPYRKEALIDYVSQGLEVDDDIIQQWFGASSVLRLLQAASTFDEMLLAVHAVCGGHEVSSETLAYVERILGDRHELDA
jgi:hypothetical protein